MKVYVATKFSAWELANRVHQRLAEAGHEPTSRWVETARELGGECARVPVGDPRREREARNDLSDVREAHAIIVLVPASGGTGMWLELGYAMGRGRQCILVGPRLDVLERTVFAELCEHAETIAEAVAMLRVER